MVLTYIERTYKPTNNAHITIQHVPVTTSPGSVYSFRRMRGCVLQRTLITPLRSTQHSPFPTQPCAVPLIDHPRTRWPLPASSSPRNRNTSEISLLVSHQQTVPGIRNQRGMVRTRRRSVYGCLYCYSRGIVFVFGLVEAGRVDSEVLARALACQ